MNRMISLICVCIGVALLLSLGAVSSLAAPNLRPGNPILSPLSNSHTAPIGVPVSITYDEAINPATVSADTFSIYGGQTGLLSGAYVVVGGMIQFSHESAFQPGELVEAVATTGTLGLSGEGPLEPTVWHFWAAVTPSSGFLHNTMQLLGNTNSLDVALGDFNGDGDLDAFVANAGQDYIWVNNGSGIFTDSGQRLGSPSKTSVDVEVGDLDRDGDLDAFVVIAGVGSYGKVWLNNGSGVFTDSGQNPGVLEGSGVALGDLDGDGDLDIFYVSRSSCRVYLNNGSAQFTDSGQALGVLAGTDVALGDLDNDGDLDAIVSNNNGYVGSAQQVFRNDGQGVFASTGQLVGVMHANDVALGDLDLDGDLDALLAIANPVGVSEAPDEVWLNDGTGFFVDSGQRIGTASTNQVALGDLDGDGDLDAYFANLMVTTELWLNDGSGVLYRSRQYLGVASSPGIGLGDLDGDGDMDVFLTHFGEPDTVWRNLDEIYWMQLPLVVK